ncbi:MAG: MerR family transcriptional regulator [Thermoanaerobaculia bacterium]
MEEKFYSIGEVSKILNIPVTTLRFFEENFPHLIKPLRTKGGHRRYSSEDIKSFKFIKEATQGTSLKKLKEHFSREEENNLKSRVEKIQESLILMDQKLRNLEAQVKKIEEKFQKLEENKKFKRWF